MARKKERRLGAALGVRRRRSRVGREGVIGREGGVELLLGHDGARGAAHLGEARSDGLRLGDRAGDEEAGTEAGLGARGEERHEVRAQRVHRLGHADAVDLARVRVRVRARVRGRGRARGRARVRVRVRVRDADAVDLREDPLAVVGGQLEVSAAPRGGEGAALG